jgi:pSer/pThr/pTyr-binding forkhead associated (FHA) protein
MTAAATPQAPPPPAGATRLGALALLGGAAQGDAVRAGPHLAIQEPGRPERIVAIVGQLTIGRGAGASVRLGDPAASRRHLELRDTGAGVAAEDLGSRNGLILNGRAARGPLQLRHGDWLTVGETVIRFADPLEPPHEPPDERGREARGAPAAVPPGAGRRRWVLPASALLAALAGLAALL